MKYLVDPQTGGEIMCEFCAAYPAVTEIEVSGSNPPDTSGMYYACQACRNNPQAIPTDEAEQLWS